MEMELSFQDGLIRIARITLILSYFGIIQWQFMCNTKLNVALRNDCSELRSVRVGLI